MFIPINISRIAAISHHILCRLVVKILYTERRMSEISGGVWV